MVLGSDPFTTVCMCDKGDGLDGLPSSWILCLDALYLDWTCKISHMHFMVLFHESFVVVSIKCYDPIP